ncbi:MAG: FGGY family carbohydrate kinase [bacterium]|nr:FGGY family carbohydrate kinase [bacterium]
MKYLLGVDFGGGSSKATLLDVRGNIVSEHSVEYPTAYPKLGWCEQEPEDWNRAFCGNTKGLLEKSGIAAEDILAVAVDSATHTWVMCDQDCKPLRPAIHWTDSRSLKQAERLRKEQGDFLFEKCFHRPDTIWTLPQILWVRENEPELFRRVRHIFFEKDYIRYCLTGISCTDYIEAQGSMLFDSAKGEWCRELLATAGIEKGWLPQVVKPADTAGGITKEAAEKTGLLEGTPVICGTTDTALEVFAAGAVHPGDVTVKLATAGRICVITDRPCPSPQLVNYAHVAEGLWYPGTATKAAASSYRWYRDTFGGGYEELNRGAEKIPIGCEGLLYHPYLNGELTPYGDPALCGSFTGVRATHTRAHFTRSVLEGVALSLLHSRKTLESLGIALAGKATVIGGGAKGELWRQILADCLGMELVKTVSSDSSLGAAMLAGVAVGVFENPGAAVRACVKEESVTEPIAEHTARYEKLFEEYVAVHDALAPIYRSRSGL